MPRLAAALGSVPVASGFGRLNHPPGGVWLCSLLAPLATSNGGLRVARIAIEGDCRCGRPSPGVVGSSKRQAVRASLALALTGRFGFDMPALLTESSSVSFVLLNQ